MNKDKKIEVKDYIMWVGKQYYPTPDCFIREAEKLGICKKIPPNIPKNLIPHQSLIFFIHRKSFSIHRRHIGENMKFCFHCEDKFYVNKIAYEICENTYLCQNCYYKFKPWYPGIIGFAIVGGFDIIVQEKIEIEKYLQGINIISISEVRQEERRGCGKRCFVGACYLVSEKDLKKIYKKIDELKIKKDIELVGTFIKFKIPKPINFPFFRGLKIFNPCKIGIKRKKSYVKENHSNLLKKFIRKIRFKCIKNEKREIKRLI